MIIFDTNVVSELMRPIPEPKVREWCSMVETDLGGAYLTSVSEAELRYGAAILPRGKRRQVITRSIERLLAEYFQKTILPFDSFASKAYAEIMAQRRAAGRPVKVSDGQIAAICHSIGGIIATRNKSDFEGCGIEIINPWAD